MRAKALLIGILLLLAGGAGALAADSSSQFAFCPKARFADCTKAVCTQTGPNAFSCTCKMKTHYSATALVNNDPQASCTEATTTTAQSRYAPVKRYQSCESSNPVWAMCLGDPCTVNRGKKTASCQCTGPLSPPSPYLVVTTKYRAKLCTNGKIYSSVQPAGNAGITAFLQTKMPKLAAPVEVTSDTAPAAKQP